MTTDFDNVFSLNRAFLDLMRRDPEARKCLKVLPAALLRRLSSLTGGQAELLASTPFLLLSFRERDDLFWEDVFSDRSNRDLFADAVSRPDELSRLIAAGLGFVWQLARQNPYTARLICGASLHWCEQLTERTIFQILAAVGTRADVLALRSGSDSELWSKLLASGISREKQVRQAAHISAFQSVLTRASMPERRKWAAAACAVRTPALRIADENGS